MGLIIFVAILLVLAILLIMWGLANEKRIDRVKGFNQKDEGNPASKSVTKRKKRNKKDIG